MSTDAPNYRALADFATAAIGYGLCDPRRLVAWADALIVASDVPPEWMMDLSIVDVSDPHALRSALRAVPGEPNATETLELLGACVLREWRASRLSAPLALGIGYDVYMGGLHWINGGRGDSLRRDLRWGSDLAYTHDMLGAGFGTDAHLREVIDCELLRFEPAIARLPWWVAPPAANERGES